MRARGLQYAIGWSLAVHALIAAVFLLLRDTTKRPAEVASDTVEIDLGPLPPRAPESPPRVKAEPERPIAGGKMAGPGAGSRLRPKASPPPDDIAAEEAPPAAAAPQVPPPVDTPSVPRLSPFAPRLRLFPDGRTITPPPGDSKRPRTLADLGHPVPDVTTHEPSSRDLPRTIRGGSGVAARVAEDGAISFEDPAALAVKGLGATFDVTDRIMRAMGDDPYKYAKHKLAEETREQRICMAVKAGEDRKRQALFLLKGHLDRIERAPGLSLAERHEAVFSMWDDCLEDGADAEPKLGAAARATVIAFIRRVFPASSPSAYAPAELAMLNRRRSSREAFDPYHDRPDAGAPDHRP